MEIKGKNYVLKYGLRSMFIFEEMTGKPFEIKTLFDTYCFCYACIIANKDNEALEFNDFIDTCDENPGIIEEFNKFMDSELKKRSALDDKKKVTKKGKN
jgi:hypothetical protein